MTTYIIGLGISVAIVLLALCYLFWCVLSPKDKPRPIKPFYVIAGAVLLSAMALFVPVYADLLEGVAHAGWKVAFLSLHNAIRLFVVDDDFSLILSQTVGLGATGRIFSSYAVVIYIVAPVLTFGFILTFFRNAFQKFKLWWVRRRELCVFSEANDKTIALAKDLRSKHPKLAMVFVNIDIEESPYRDDIHLLGAIAVKEELTQLHYKMKNRKEKLTFFLLSKNEEANVEESIKLIERYGKYPKTHLYLLASSAKSEQIFRKLPKQEMKIRRVNEYYALVSQHLYKSGHFIFDSAIENPQTGEKDISALVIGLGKYGKHILSSLAWFCQMDGYHAEIHAFDSNKYALDEFTQLCPELMSDKHNGDFTTKGEAHYKIDIYPGFFANTYSFEEKVKSIGKITYVFVGLGSDDININTSVNLRILFRRMGINPVIQTVVSNTDCLNILGASNEYEIDFVGHKKSLYTEEGFLSPKINDLALARHLNWGDEENFWKNEYEYRSSIASAIHTEYKKIYAKHIGGNKPPKERNEQELWAMRILEHQRWNAYMRSIGFVFAPVRDKSANTHHCLVPFDDLPYEEQIKDDF